MAYAKISELNSSKEDWVIQVRLCRMWEAINLKNENDIIGLEMVFVDDKVYFVFVYVLFIVFVGRCVSMMQH